METDHQVHFGSAHDMAALKPESVHLVVTSPPYPMIEMWDEIFAAQDPAIGEALREQDGWAAFEGMHRFLDRVWQQVHRVLVPGGIACINIGDATRTLRHSFALYPNHSRILSSFLGLGFSPLPAILWRKQTNAPNKFMGSGMLPPGAYVTLEHEYVLILRKGDKREFLSSAAKGNRGASSFFWEERNAWFSDVWFDLKGTTQTLFDEETRNRSGAFPFELPYRLISMFSVKGDTILDPFLGVGTTSLAAMAAGRSSVGYEIDPSLRPTIASGVKNVVKLANNRIDQRLSDHADFIRSRYESRGPFRHRNRPYGFPVVTRQEIELLLNPLSSVKPGDGDTFSAKHLDAPHAEDLQDWESFFERSGADATAAVAPKPKRARKGKAVQLDLFESL